MTRSATWGLLAALLGLGCDLGSSPASPAPIDRYAARYAEAVCGVLGSCCADNGLPFERDRCVLGGAGFVQVGVDRAKAAGAGFDEQAAESCISGSARLAAACLPPSSDPAVAAACARVFLGKGAPGASCASDLDCASSSAGRGSCLVSAGADGGAAAGVCVARTSPAAVGDRCGVPEGGPVPATLADCRASALQCALGSLTCQPPTPLGDPCGALTLCAAGSTCDDTGRCAPARAAAAACARDAECASGLCLRGSCARNAVGGLAPCTGASG